MTGSSRSGRRLSALACGAAFLAVALLSCMDDPSSVGIGLLPPGDFLVVDSVRVTSTASRSARAGLQPAFAARLMVGRRDQLEAWSLINFAPLPDTLAGISVLSAELQLRSLYAFGNEMSPLSFRVRKITAPWYADSTTFDSLAMPGFLDPDPVSEVSVTPVPDSGIVTAPLDTALVNEWFRSLDADISAYGIALEPTNNDVIYGFGRLADASESTRPTLQVTYLRADTPRVDTALIRAGSDLFLGSIADTSWASSPDRMYVRNGIGFRGVMEFALDTLPVRPAVHRATLEVVLDAAGSDFNRFTVDSLRAVYMVDNEFQDFLTILNEPPLVIDGRTHYRFTVTQIVQAWLRGSTGRTIGVAGLNENNAFDGFALFGAGAADSTLRPSITILYSDTQ